ncbi:hypothetical protein [Marinicella litoralis]|uniref:Uncharacterized protein n=1 Tax=Marinicella litoralis TaxID=644220 RepID=A0A4R6XAU0_9GAMM|nr:hypothetical protein [Marinicella litoralis]TDR16325.1 hypothetical protein C8D91_2852 [Marinicella litoralis]
MENLMNMSINDSSINSKSSIEQQKKQIMTNIKELQRDLIKASFKQTAGSTKHAELLQLINDERAKIKGLNQQLAGIN